MAGSEILSDQASELLAITKSCDSIELKVSVPPEDHATKAQDLGIDVTEAEIRQVVFFETPDLALDKAGVLTQFLARLVATLGSDAPCTSDSSASIR